MEIEIRMKEDDTEIVWKLSEESSEKMIIDDKYRKNKIQGFFRYFKLFQEEAKT